MQKIELSAEEAEVLREFLEQRLRELDIEIDRTDTHDFKEMLKRRRNVLRHVLEMVARLPLAV